MKNDDATINTPRPTCSPTRGVRTRFKRIEGPSQITIATAWKVSRAQTKSGIG